MLKVKTMHTKNAREAVSPNIAYPCQDFLDTSSIVRGKIPRESEASSGKYLKNIEGVSLFFRFAHRLETPNAGSSGRPVILNQNITLNPQPLNPKP